MSLLANSNAIESGGYNIDRSLRFRSSASAYLSRTFGAGNRQTWTYSAWVKRGALTTTQTLFSLCNQGGSSGAFTQVSWSTTTNDALELISYNSGVEARKVTTPIFRDPSAWYHVVAVFDTTNATAADRLRLYVNGQRITTFDVSVNPSQNYNGYIGSIGYRTTIGTLDYTGLATNNFVDGYLAEVNFIDGQALTPSSFGQTDAVTGVWTPKKYTGTYGTNGFYLPFSDNTSATTLAYDKSGNNNNWTPNNISTTAGATYDSMTDVPTLTSATAANYCVLNPLDKGTSVNVADGNLAYSVPTAASYGGVRGTFAITQKAYWEVTNTCGALPMFVGILNASVNVIGTADLYAVSGQATYRSSNGNKNINGTETAYGASNTTNDVIGVAYDPDTGELTFYKNGTSQGTISTGFTGYTYFPAVYDSTSSVCSAVFNFGQRPFSYTPPTGFKALNTFNLPDPTIKKPNQYMDVRTYSGTTSFPYSPVTDLAFQPDLVWVKTRSNTYDHVLYDSVRGTGTGASLASNNTNQEGFNANYANLSSFNSNGFTVQSTPSTNILAQTGQTFVGWQWKKGATPGFDIVTFTSPASGNFTVNHSLGVTPAMVIVKTRDTAGWNWHVWHKSLSSATNSVLVLNSTNAVNSSFNMWGTSGATSTTIGVTTGNPVPANSACVAYLFAEIPGFSKFGSYTGNGSADGPFVYCGFRPKYIMWKRTDAVADWTVFDTARDTYNVAGPYLNPNTSAAEITDATVQMDLLSNGFKVRGTWQGVNASGGTFIFAAFAESPFKTSLAR